MAKDALGFPSTKHTPRFTLVQDRPPLTSGLSTRSLDQQIDDLMDFQSGTQNPLAGTMFDSTRVARPGYVPTTNGCGPEDMGWAVPDGVFAGPCNNHDKAFGTYDKFGVEDFNKKNEQFRKEMHEACNESMNPLCDAKADLYADVASSDGWDYYNAAQYKASMPVQAPWEPLSDAVPAPAPPSFEFDE